MTLLTPRQTAPPPAQRFANNGGVPLFSQIRSSRSFQPRRILLYGVQGVGKSTWAAQAPGAIFLPTEDGLGNLDAQSFPLLASWPQFQEAIESLYTEPHQFQTVVIDSLDRLELLIWEDVCKVHNFQSIEDAGYGKGYVFALSRWQWLLRGLDALRSARDMTVIALAHSKIERFEAPDSPAYDRYSIRLHKLASALVQEWADEVLFATYEVFVRVEKAKFGAEKGKAVGTGARILRTTERPFASAKNRLGLPEELPLDWPTFASYLPRDPLTAHQSTQPQQPQPAQAAQAGQEGVA